MNALVKFKPAPPRRPYRGRKARRQAFYSRQRLCRLLSRLYDNLPHARRLHQQALHALEDSIKFGTNWCMVGPETPFERTYHATQDPNMVWVVDVYRA